MVRRLFAGKQNGEPVINCTVHLPLFAEKTMFSSTPFHRIFVIAALFSLSTVTAVQAQLPFNEGFDDDGNGSRYTLSSQFNDHANGYFDVAFNPAFAEDGSYTNIDGPGYFLAEDTDDSQGSRFDEQTIVFNIPITGEANLAFSGFFAAEDEAPATCDIGDHIFIEAQIDAAAVQRLLSFESDSTIGSRPLAPDTDFDGVGDGTPFGLAFEEFTALIRGTGNNLTLTARIQMDSGFESVGLDNFTVIPEPSGVILGGLALATLMGCGVRRHRRRASRA